jgi:tetratricopeptide (TPR) repeat protein
MTSGVYAAYAVRIRSGGSLVLAGTPANDQVGWMNANHTPRYCRCGARLGRDHAADLCSPCEKQLAALRVGPAELPADFWETEQLHDALAAQHIGLICRAYRKHPHYVALFGKDGMPQSVVGGWLNLTQAQVSRIENGPASRHLDNLAHWARVLCIPEHLLWFRPSGSPTHRYAPTMTSTPPIVGSPSTAAAGRPKLADQIRANGHTDALAMQSFRAADKQLGGGHLYPTVVRYLNTELAPRLFGLGQNQSGQQVFTAAAALTEMAGWMAYDAGRATGARHHFNRALDLAKAGGDQQLVVHVLASMSHLAHHVDEPELAIQLAHRGQDALSSGPRLPELRARLLAMQARGFAALHQPGDCVQLLMQAEQGLSESADAPLSPWVSPFDEGSLASEAARCMRQLGDLSEARRQAERILELRPADRTRSRAFGQLVLATVLIGQGKPDEACAVALDVLAATESLSSLLVIQQLVSLRQLLEPHGRNAAVAVFLGQLEATLENRMWFYRWLTQDGQDPSTGAGEGL